MMTELLNIIGGDITVPKWLAVICCSAYILLEHFLPKTNLKSNSIPDLIMNILKWISSKGGAGLQMFLIFCLCFGCIKYISDINFMRPNDAYASEAYISINSRPCVGVNQKVGACTWNGKVGQILTIVLPSRPYNYKFKLSCSNGYQDKGFEVDKNVSKKFQITVGDPLEVGHFMCKGRFKNFDDNLSDSFTLTVIATNKDYISRDPIEVGSKGRRSVVSPGRFANHLEVCTQNSCVWYKARKNREALKKFKNVKIVSVRSYSDIGRWNYYGI